MTVPNGWKQVPLSEVCRVVEGQVDPRDPEYRDLPHINGEVIESGSGRLLKLRTAAEDGLISGKYLFEQGMVLYSKLRPYLRKVAIAPSRGVCSADMYPLMFDPKRVDPKFAMFTLLAEPFTRYAVEESRRARMPKLNRAQLMAWEMPLPQSLEIQRRIATDLAEQLATADSAINACHERLAAAELLSAAYLAETFEGPEARSWDRRRIGEVAPVQTGFAFKSEWFVQQGGVRVLRNANIHQAFIEWSDSVAIRNDVSERFGAFALDVGDIVLTLDRPLVAGGLKVARIGVADRPALLNQRVARFQVDASAVDVEFLYSFLRCPRFSDTIRGHDQSLGVPHISPGQVERVELPLPPLMTQRRVVSALSHRLEGVEALVDSCREESAAIETLPQEYLREAFGGAS